VRVDLPGLETGLGAAVNFLHAIKSVLLPVLDLPAASICALGLDLDQGVSMRGLDCWTRAKANAPRICLVF